MFICLDFILSAQYIVVHYGDFLDKMIAFMLFSQRDTPLKFDWHLSFSDSRKINYSTKRSTAAGSFTD